VRADAEHRKGSKQGWIGWFDRARYSERHLARAFTVGEDHDGMPGAGQRRPPAQPGRTARCRSQVVEAAGDTPRQRAIMVRQLIRAKPQGDQDLRIGAVRTALHECRRERHLDERERVPTLSQVRRMERSATEGTEHLPDGMLRRLREIADRRAVVKIEAADGLPGDQV
jgi:hypothetical protein